ncbi:MAG: thioredoxin family protein [Candidatus Bathyarchaeia archaeon]
MPIRKIDFAKFEKEIIETGKPYKELLAAKMGKAYVVAITRDACPYCDRLKPKLEKLAEKASQKHDGAVDFVQVHVKYSAGKNEESLRSKDLFGHYFYPTVLILLRTKDRGAIEYQRSVYPRISDLERAIKRAVETAKMLAEQ